MFTLFCWVHRTIAQLRSSSGRRPFIRFTSILLIFGLISAVGPSVASAEPTLPVDELCDDLGLLGCDGSVPLSVPASSGSLLGATGLTMSPSASGGLSGGLSFAGPRGGPAGLGLTWTGSGDGQVGVGFALGGVARIDRCAQTPLLNDVFGGGVDYAAAIEDATWCLNGMQLEDVSGDGSEFRSKVESGVIVRREGAANWTDADAHFVAEYRNGVTTRFDLRLGGTTLLGFLPTETRDASSNTVSYRWGIEVGVEPDPFFAWMEYQLDEVQWGGNSIAGRPNEYTAQLSYEDRPHPIESFAGGLQLRTTRRLASVEISRRVPLPGPSDFTLDGIREYQLGYLPDNNFDPRSYLSTLRTCERPPSGALGQWDLCTRSTILDWQGLKTDGNAFSASPAPATDLYISPDVPNGSVLNSPYEIGGLAAQRWVQMNSNGTLAAGFASQPDSFFPLVPTGGEAGHPKLGTVGNTGSGGTLPLIDIHRFVTNREYFYTHTTCVDREPDLTQGNTKVDVCGAELSNQVPTACNSSTLGSFFFDPSEVASWSDELVDECLGQRDDYAKNAVYSRLRTGFAAQMTNLVASSRLRADLDCDGENDDWIEPNMFGGASNTSFGEGTAPAFVPTHDIATEITGYGQWGPRQFYKDMGAYVRSLADAYSGLVIADFNGDCNADVYQMVGKSYALDRIFIGDGAGSFVETDGPSTWLQHLDAGWITTDNESAKKLRVRASDKSRFRFGHFNNDGLLDVMYVNGWIEKFSAPVSKRSPATVWLNNGDGTWDSVFDGPELVVRAPLESSSFASPDALALTNRDIASVQVGHMNADGCADLFVLPRPTSKSDVSTANARIYYSHCDGSFDRRHADSVNLPLSLTFHGREKRDGRALGAFQVEMEHDEDLPQEVQLLWQQPSAETGSVHLVDLNGDGLDDIYKVHEDARDDVWLNMAGTEFVQMSGLEFPGIGAFPTDQGGTAHPDVSWDIDSQLQFDVGRFAPLVPGTGRLPGMFVAGELQVGSNDIWRIDADRFYLSDFAQPKLRAISDGLGNTSVFDWGLQRGNPHAVSWVVTGVETTMPATAGGAGVSQVTHRTEYTYSGLTVDPLYGSKGFAVVTSEQTAPPGDGLRRAETTFWQGEQRTSGTPKHTREWVLSDGQWVLLSESSRRLNVDWLDDPGFGLRDPLAYRITPSVDCANGWGQTTTFRLNGTVAGETCTTTAVADIWGNVDWTRTTRADGSSVEVRHLFAGANSGTDEATMRYHGLASSEETIVTDWDGDVQTSTQWTSWNLNHLKPSAVTVPGPNGQQLYSHFAYNTQGNVVTKNAGGSDIPEVSETFTFVDGTVPDSVTKVIGGVTHRTQTIFADRTLEVPTSIVDANEISFHSEHDAAGRLIRTYSDSGTETRYRYGTTPSGFETTRLGGLWRDWVIPNDGPPSYAVYDRLSRVVREGVATAVGWSVVDTYYDERGANSEKSLPYISSLLELGSRDHLEVISSYDALGRVTSAITASGNLAETLHETASLPTGTNVGPYYAAYPQNLIATTSTTLDGVTSWASFDGSGQVIVITNALGNQAFKDYDASGNLVAERDPDGNETTWEYDDWGRLTTTDDPDFGSSTLTYDAAGNVTATLDNKGNRAEMAYDGLGRLLTSEIFDSSGVRWDGSTFTYDTKPNGVGYLATQNSDHESVDYSYTVLGQLATVSRSITADGQTHTTATTAHYDLNGRNYRTQVDNRFFDNIFDPNTGNVVEVIDPNTGDPFWGAAGYDQFGRLALTSLGNGTAQRLISEDDRDLPAEIGTFSPDGTLVRRQEFSWDLRGNLSDRRWSTDKGHEQSETFTYDLLDRLETSQVDGLSLTSRTYTATNNLLTKSDYLGGAEYRYLGQFGAGPNTPSSVGNQRLHYDANGNLIAERALRTRGADIDTGGGKEEITDPRDARGDDQGASRGDKEPSERGDGREAALNPPGGRDDTITPVGPDSYVSVLANIWTPHNRLEAATRSTPNDELLAQLGVTYGVEGTKVHQRITDDTSSVADTWYLSGGLRLVDVDGTFERQLDVSGPGGAIATIRTSDATGFETILYRHVDHLGSPVHYSDATGTVVSDVAYGPDGAARSSSDWSTLALGERGDNPLEDAWGGHDGLELFGLTNLGARIYDQHRGQFIQPDTLGDQLRYGYGNNNPLSHVDPDGHYAAALHFAGSFLMNSAAAHFGVGYGFSNSFGADGSASTYGSGAAPAFTSGASSSAVTNAQTGGIGRFLLEGAFEWAVYGAFKAVTGGVTPVAIALDPLMDGLAQAITIYVFDTLIDGKDYLSALKEKHSMSGLIDLLAGTPMTQVATNPTHLTNLIGAVLPGALVKKYSSEIEGIASGLAKSMEDMLEAGRRLGEQISDGISAGHSYVRNLFSNKSPSGDGGGGGSGGGGGNGGDSTPSAPKGPYRPRSASEFEPTISKEWARSTKFVIEHPGTGSHIEGFLRTNAEGDLKLEIDFIYVSPDFRRQDYGTDLYYQVIKNLVPAGKPFKVVGRADYTNKALIESTKDPARYAQLTQLNAVLGGSFEHLRPAQLGFEGMSSVFTPNKIIPRRRPDHPRRRTSSTARPRHQTVRLGADRHRSDADHVLNGRSSP